MLWGRAQGVVVVTASGNSERIRKLGEVATLPDVLTPEEIEEITTVGKTIHYRFYVCFFYKPLGSKLNIWTDRTHGGRLPNPKSSK